LLSVQMRHWSFAPVELWRYKIGSVSELFIPDNTTTKLKCQVDRLVFQGKPNSPNASGPLLDGMLGNDEHTIPTFRLMLMENVNHYRFLCGRTRQAK